MKSNSRNAANLDATQLIKIATKNGATSLGLSNQVGQILPTFCADFLSIDLETTSLRGIQRDELTDALIFGCGNAVIKRVMVAGIER